MVCEENKSVYIQLFNYSIVFLRTHSPYMKTYS